MTFIVCHLCVAHSENIYPERELRGSPAASSNPYSGGEIWFSGVYHVDSCPSVSADIRTIASKGLQQDYEKTKFVDCEKWSDQFRYILNISRKEESGSCQVQASFACGPDSE